jgi:hypothetical protein
MPMAKHASTIGLLPLLFCAAAVLRGENSCFGRPTATRC